MSKFLDRYGEWIRWAAVPVGLIILVWIKTEVRSDMVTKSEWRESMQHNTEAHKELDAKLAILVETVQKLSVATAIIQRQQDINTQRIRDNELQHGPNR